MIHNTFLIKISGKVLATAQYWPIEVSQSEIEEFISTREEIKDASGSEFMNIPLNIHDHKMMALEVESDLLLLMVGDHGEDDRALSEKLKKGARILQKYSESNGSGKMIQNFESIIESSVTTKLKIALVGEGGVGKTTTLHLLLGDTPPTQYVPTIALNLETVENIRFGNYSLVLWDFAGQERFRNLWKFYFHGADVIFLVCDSSLRNVIVSKDIMKLIRRDAPKVPLFVIANKQDKPNAMRPEVIQKILGVPTYPMVAVDKSRRDEMLRILMNAAAQYVGVTLPDLPATEILRFTDELSEEIAQLEGIDDLHEEETSDEEELEDEDEYEIVEVLVDEDGHIIDEEDMDDGEYEIVEEYIEETDGEYVAEADEETKKDPLKTISEALEADEDFESEIEMVSEEEIEESLKALKSDEVGDISTEQHPSETISTGTIRELEQILGVMEPVRLTENESPDDEVERPLSITKQTISDLEQILGKMEPVNLHNEDDEDSE
ncbi:MAG: GTP-binding protein [Candidatus Lokiarchaeota archaeon]|nr:GTP-binding protein [Candidatus Lokiarchaeota archaeon]